MFIESIISGVSLLRFWQVWVAIVLQIICVFGFLSINAIWMTDKQGPIKMVLGFISLTFGGLIVQGIVMGILIAFLLPIMFGGGATTPLSIIIGNLWQICIAGFIAIVTVTLLGFIPFIGGAIAESPGIQSFLEGIIIYNYYSKGVIDEIVLKKNIVASVYPGFWQSVGYLFISWLIIQVITFIFVALLGFFNSRVGGRDYSPLGEDSGFILGAILTGLGGLLPLFMYAQYITISISNAVK
jgi:hypothetical protein